MIKLALPTGDLRTPVAEMLSSLGLRVEGYGEGSRQYKLNVPGHDDVRVRVFRERDIPVQVALGNYDIGVTSLSWIIEMNVRFPQQPLIPLADLQIGQKALFAAIAPNASRDRASALSKGRGRAGDALAHLPIPVRIVSEYPNIAEAFARAARLPRYRVQAVAGAAEAYPPEDADLAILAAPDEAAIRTYGLQPVMRLLDNSAWLVANAASLATKDLTAVLVRIGEASVPSTNGVLHLPSPVSALTSSPSPEKRERRSGAEGALRLAVPDGHQQRHVHGALAKAGITFDGYEEKTFVRRPNPGIAGLDVKVIRPQDMPQLVALGEFDIAITGLDLLSEHLFAFPSSPAHAALDLQVSQYNLSAVVDGNLPAANLAEAVAHWHAGGKRPLVIASEFAATADHYARSRHFWRYQVIPIAGASEGFVPEDADILIEGTETGRTIAENNLKIIDTIYRSTTCLIARKNAQLEGKRKAVYEELFGLLQASVAQG